MRHLFAVLIKPTTLCTKFDGNLAQKKTNLTGIFLGVSKKQHTFPLISLLILHVKWLLWGCFQKTTLPCRPTLNSTQLYYGNSLLLMIFLTFHVISCDLHIFVWGVNLLQNWFVCWQPAAVELRTCEIKIGPCNKQRLCSHQKTHFSPGRAVA